MWRAFASNALTLLIVALFLLGGVILFGQSTYRAAGPLTEAVCLRVQPGSNMGRVSTDLEQRGAIANGMLFRVGADYSDKSDKLKAGAFLVPAGASMEEIVEIVTRGGASTCGTEVVYRVGVTRKTVQVRELDPATGRFVEVVSFNPAEEEAPADYTRVRAEADTRYRIAVAEGVTSWQVMDSLNNIELLSGEISRPAEGVLAPDSYEVRVGDTRESVIARMQEAQEILVAAAWESRAEDVPLNSPEELLILASIIEKETGVAEERRQVASVFANRLDRGMRLQTDPTVIYGVTEGVGVLGRGLRQSELRRETPWNTYVIEGLPPTPIANPGRASLEAAANPDETPYIFFVADGTGGHAFATTLSEHNQNVAKWRQIEAERANQ
ncbi:endolytic transglycosylase MltG [Shimia sp. R11_0]|uniref:endolytic transglycosylase MltG n=1 Tax=Shimia sp. R11_0 TaxID=2821096 RepID=UPI001ADB9451|nr:endolytic transglycosylase MltG [Shimia sp. R11_0]MBO9479309.1 endolytic transglycosylase MltG [Shimia sp. R11_0]